MSVEIISSTDDSYIEYNCRSYAKRKRDYCEASIDPLQSDLQKALRDLERATLELMKRTAGIECDQVLKVTREHPHLVFGDYDFFELDGIIRIDEKKICFCEIKITDSLHWAFKSAKKQLRKRLDLCRNSCWESFGIAVCFCFASPDTENSSAPFLSFDRLVDFLHQHPAPQSISRVIVDAESLKRSLDDHVLNGTGLFGGIAEIKQLLANPSVLTDHQNHAFSNSLAKALDLITQRDLNNQA
jgi:hypothetical protein